MRTRTFRYVLLPLFLAAAAVGCELTKSENPLSPSVAGPIAGVEVSAPKVLEPAAGANISGDRQPITLLIENASSNGQRPLSYIFEVSTDSGFSNLVFTRRGVPSGEGGRTSLTLPDRLPTGRLYYWRAKADDGANAGPYSNGVPFNIFTPVAFEKPALIAPVNGVTVSDNVPDFRIANAPRVGNAVGVSYIIEVATSSSFAGLVAAWQVNEQPNQTMLTAPSGLPQGVQLFWRARAIEPTALGPWSDTQTFRTPVPVVAPAPLPTPGPGGSCSSNTPLGILLCERSRYPAHMSESQLVTFLRSSAVALNRAGIAGGPFGLLQKTGGANCGGYSCDILCAGQGTSQRQYDVLLDAEGDQTVTWGAPKTYPNIRIDNCIVP